MSLLSELSAQLAPHTKHLTDTIDKHGREITERLDELKQESDLGRADTEDRFQFIIRNSVIPAAIRLGGPTLGEIWMIQSIAVNGIPNLSPAFTIRTNTGRLIFACAKEAMGNEGVAGNVYLLQGEELIFEPGTSGAFDFTIAYVLRKYPRQAADAGYGVSEEVFEERARGEHESERDFSGQDYTPVQ